MWILRGILQKIATHLRELKGARRGGRVPPQNVRGAELVSFWRP